MEPIQTQNPNPSQPRPMLEFGEAIRICWKKFSDFKGRARRSEYWWWCLLCFIIYTATRLIGHILSLGDIFKMIAWLILIIPSLAAGTRRLHDTGRSGWWIVAEFVMAVIMWIMAFSVESLVYYSSAIWVIFYYIMFLLFLFVYIVVLYFSVLDSHKGENQYGPSPKYQ